MTNDAVYWWVAVLFYFGILSVPILTLLATPYEGPESLEATWKRAARAVPSGLFFFVISNWSRAGFAFDKWYWSMLAVIPVMLGLILLVDWLILHRRNKQTDI